jgi:hypothetical protein
VYFAQAMDATGTQRSKSFDVCDTSITKGAAKHVLQRVNFKIALSGTMIVVLLFAGLYG